MITRRQVLGSAALAAAATQAQAGPRNIVISSSNGARACAKAMELIKSGADTLDAVIAGVNINELDPEDNSVGYGGLPNEDGVVELDASVMHGPTRRAGSVASIRNIKTPSNVAKLVMEQTDHVMLVGDGALKFARAIGFQEENLLIDKSRGEMSGVTTTSGLAWKIAGRVGDSPIIGAGLYVDQEIGAAGSTGRGEENIRVAGAHTIVENMRHGMAPKEACLDALKRVARNYNNDRAKLLQFDISFYALRRDGQYASASLWNGRKFTVNDGAESRLEASAGLLER